MANDFRVIFQGASEAASRYGGGGDSGPGMEDMPQEVRAGFANLQKEMARRVPPLTAFFKSMGIEVSIKSMLKQSQIFTSYVGTIFQLMGALVDVMLAPLLPLLVPVARWIGSKIPVLADWARRKGEEISQKLEPITNFLKGHTWESGWDALGEKWKGWMRSWSVPFLGEWGASLAGWFGDHPGWTTIGGILAAVLAKKFVFALPKLLLKLGWGATKVATGMNYADDIAKITQTANKTPLTKGGGSFQWLKKSLRGVPLLGGGYEALMSLLGFGEVQEAMGTGHATMESLAEIGGGAAFAFSGSKMAGGAGGLMPLFAAYAIGDQFQGYLKANENLRKQVELIASNPNASIEELLDPSSGMMMISKFLSEKNIMPTGGTPFPIGTYEWEKWKKENPGQQAMLNASGGLALAQRLPYRPEGYAVGSEDSRLRDVEGKNPYIVFNLTNSDGGIQSSYTMPFVNSWAFQHGLQLEEAGQEFTFQIHNHGIELE